MKESDNRQKKIIEEFKILENDLEMSLNYFMDIGEKLDSLEEKFKEEENLVSGCQSKVWLIAKNKDEKIYYEGDSNTSITKGLLALLIRIFSDLSIKEVLNTKIFFPKEIGLNRFIGTQRSNGFYSIEKKIKYLAMGKIDNYE